MTKKSMVLQSIDLMLNTAMSFSQRKVKKHSYEEPMKNNVNSPNYINAHAQIEKMMNVP
jgi:hypothetical protein